LEIETLFTFATVIKTERKKVNVKLMTKNKRSAKKQFGTHEQWTVDIWKMTVTYDDRVYLEAE
jgi:hypothetical protein